MKETFLIFLLFFLSLFLFPFSAEAICEGPLVPCGTEENPSTCGFCHIFELINNIFEFFLTCLTPVIGGFMLVVAGVYFVFSGPSPSMMQKARSILTAAVAGIMIVLLSWVALNTLLSFLGIAEWTGLMEGWWEIDCEL